MRSNHIIEASQNWIDLTTLLLNNFDVKNLEYKYKFKFCIFYYLWYFKLR